MEENKQVQIRSWRDIQVDLNSPMGMVLDMINVLNQRLATVEDNTFVDYEGEKISLTEMYARQAQDELAKRQSEENQSEETVVE